MPYFITDKAESCAGWATIKEDGEVIGCHKTKSEAVKHMVAVSLAEEMEPGGERAVTGAVIVDIDDTLIHRGQPMKRVIDYVNALPGRKYIITGRMQSQHDATVTALRDAGVQYSGLFMKQTDEPTSTFKKRVAQKLKSRQKIALAIDNDEKNRAAFSSLGIPTLNPSSIKAERHLPGKHDQSSHAHGDTISKHNQLPDDFVHPLNDPHHGKNTPERVASLHNYRDPSQTRVYEAESSIDKPKEFDYSTKPNAPKLKDFAAHSDYLNAYKDYAKEHNKWAVEQRSQVLSGLGKKHLDGTRKGIENYVNEVTSSDWFVKEFGVPHPQLGKPKVEISKAKGYTGQVSLTKKNGKYSYKLKVNETYVKEETTLMHEIAHHATHLSVKNSYEGHGTEFRKAHLTIVENIVGKEHAMKLEEAYASKGLA